MLGKRLHPKKSTGMRKVFLRGFSAEQVANSRKLVRVDQH